MKKFKFRVYDYNKKEMIYLNGIFNNNPFTEKSRFPQYESIKEFHKLSDIM